MAVKSLYAWHTNTRHDSNVGYALAQGSAVSSGPPISIFPLEYCSQGLYYMPSVTVYSWSFNCLIIILFWHLIVKLLPSLHLLVERVGYK